QLVNGGTGVSERRGGDVVRVLHSHSHVGLYCRSLHTIRFVARSQPQMPWCQAQRPRWSILAAPSAAAKSARNCRTRATFSGPDARGDWMRAMVSQGPTNSPRSMAGMTNGRASPSVATVMVAVPTHLSA